MEALITAAVQLVFMAVAAIITGYVIPWIKSHVEKSKLEMVEKWASAGVSAMEQLYKGKAGSGADKKAYVTQFLKEILTAKNIALSDRQVEILVEAAVNGLNKGNTTIASGITTNIVSAAADAINQVISSADKETPTVTETTATQADTTATASTGVTSADTVEGGTQ